MKIPGYCEKCRKVKQVQVNVHRLAGGRVPTGLCSQCEEIERGFTCPRCRRTSHNPDDIRERYCGNCHDWTGPNPPPPAFRRRRP